MCLAVPGRVIQIYEENDTVMGRVNFGGVVKEVCLIYLPDLAIGDYALVHAGFAISRVDESAAEATLKMFAELGMLDAELNELKNEGDI